MTPPRKPPPLYLAKAEVAGGRIPGDQWPCVACWAQGCDTCKGSGIGTREQFISWYKGVMALYEKERSAYQKHLDRVGQKPVFLSRGFIIGTSQESSE